MQDVLQNTQRFSGVPRAWISSELEPVCRPCGAACASRVSQIAAQLQNPDRRFLRRQTDRSDIVSPTTSNAQKHVTRRKRLKPPATQLEMREFMHYITNAFYRATDWHDDNTYKELNVTARELIDFPIPLGLRLTLSSLATPHFATSYHLGSVGIVDGSISYLHTSVPLAGVAAQSDRIPLPTLLRSYRELHDIASRVSDTHDGPGLFPLHLPSWLARSTTTTTPPTPAPGQPHEEKNRSTLLYGRLYLPQSLLEGLVVKRLTPSLQVQLSAVSEQTLRNGGTLLGLIQYDQGKYEIEGLASSDGGLLGIRGLYNFGGDAASLPAAGVSGCPGASENNGTGQTGEREREREREWEGIYGRFSAGGELYYGTLNKSGGMSLGIRFATLPTYRGTPLTATLTVNPLMGNINATYAVLARDYCALATRMEFNVYSYESDWAVGMELWSSRRPAGFLLGVLPTTDSDKMGVITDKPTRRERSFQAKMEWRLDDPEPERKPEAEAVPAKSPASVQREKYRGVLKARLDQNLRMGLLWEGRIKSLIFSLGSGVDLHRLDEPFRNLGLEVQYSS